MNIIFILVYQKVLNINKIMCKHIVIKLENQRQREELKSNQEEKI